jgi:SAM-dependent methyltransferase
MAVLSGSLGYWLLQRIGKNGDNSYCSGQSYAGRSKLETLFGPQIWDELRDKDVIDFGCGIGTEAIEMAKRGARTVTGVDIRETVLIQAGQAAESAGVSDRCHFTSEPHAKADVIVSLDSFEHFADPGQVLSAMRHLIQDEGEALIAFGPPWLHPFGGHLFSVFPWAHLLFTEDALIRWRSGFKTDGATRFTEVEGGLNMMTIRRFEALIKRSDFELRALELVPIRKLRPLAGTLTREFTTAVVRCRLGARREG